jgi:hypothetical protein
MVFVEKAPGEEKRREKCQTNALYKGEERVLQIVYVENVAKSGTESGHHFFLRQHFEKRRTAWVRIVEVC